MATRQASGRRVLLAFGAAAVVVGFVVGSFVGGVSADRGEPVVAFGLVPLPAGPVAVGVFAGLLGLLFVGGLFGAVRLASRFDDARVEE
ncbi:MAG: hypothetical protein A07HB70_01744 [uncultured archaeon A07HB70]|nr:MAG: hypothetical protein A07HB70_01744 [uncultured archaeon A07HB70]